LNFAEPEAGHELGFSWRLLLPPLTFEVAMPIILFFVLTNYGFSTLLALVAGGAFPVLSVGRTWVETHKVEPLGAIVITFMALGTAASLISGSVFFAQVKESILTAIFGLLCLGSLIAGERPLMFLILRQLIVGEDPDRLQWWEHLWEHSRFRRTQRVITFVWGVAYLIEAPVRVILAKLLAPAQVVVISPVMGFGVMLALAGWTRHYITRSRSGWYEQKLTNSVQRFSPGVR
jgi:intracellular septation protein A